MRARRLLIAAPVAACAVAMAGGVPMGAFAAGAGTSVVSCDSTPTWQLSGWLGTGNSSGTVTQSYAVPEGSGSPWCASAGAGAWYSLGQQVPPVPVGNGFYVQQQSTGPQVETNSYNGTCAEASVFSSQNMPATDGFLIGGMVYVGFPYTQSFGLTDEGVWQETDVFATFNPCFESYMTGAGSWNGGYYSAYAP